MITTIFNNGNSRFGLTLLPLSELERLSLIFDTFEARDLFISQFPKSVKVKPGTIIETINDKRVDSPYCSLTIMSSASFMGVENKITGAENESGNKRMIRFYNAVKVELEKQ